MLSLNCGTKWIWRISENPSERAGATKCFLPKDREERCELTCNKEATYTLTCKITRFDAAAQVNRKEFLLIAVKNDVVDFGMFGIRWNHLTKLIKEAHAVVSSS